ncbi:hypothetical protein JYT84_00490 [bacterium AH-315-M10]|nr:hypothetical protein [bacterium AH-315-M10]
MEIRTRGGFLVCVIALLGCSLVLSGCKSSSKPKKASKKAAAKKGAKAPAGKKAAKAGPKKGAPKPAPQKGDLTAKEKGALVNIQQNVRMMNNLRKTAQSKLAANKPAAAQKDLAVAVSLYQDVKGNLRPALMKKHAPGLDKAHAAVQNLLKEVNLKLGKSSGELDSIQKMLRDEEEIRKQQAEVKAKNHFKLATAALRKEKFDESIDNYNKVLETIRWAPYKLAVGDLEKRAKAGLDQAKRLRRDSQDARRRKQIKQARDRAADAAKKERELKRRRIEYLFNRAIEHFKRKEFGKSEELAKEILRIDPLNKIAQRLHEDSVESRHEHARAEFIRSKVERWRRFHNDMLESRIPYASLLRFPSEEHWKRISKRKRAGELKIALHESDSVKKIRGMLDEKRITLDFTETPFTDVVQFIQQVTQVNIVIDQAAKSKLAEAGGLVTLQVKDLRLKDALSILLKFTGLTFVFKQDVLFITTPDSEHTRGLALPRIHDIRDLTVKIQDFKGPDIKLANAGSGGGGPAGAIFTEEKETEPTITKEELVELLKSSVAPDTWEQDKYSLDAIGGQLLVVHTPEVQNQIAKFLADLRSFAGLMVNVETRFVEVTDDFLSEIGVEFRGLGGVAGTNVVQPGQIGISPEGTPLAGFLDNTAGGAPSLFAPTAAVGTPPTPGIQAGSLANGPGPLLGSPGSVPFSGFFLRKGAPGSRTATDVRARTSFFNRTLGQRLTSTGGMSLQWATLGGEQLNMLVTAVRKSQKAATVSSPRLTAFNTQRAYVTVVNQRAYIKDYDVEIAQNSVAADPEIGTVQDGLVLDVRPTVSHDRKYVTLEMRPTISTVTQLRGVLLNLGGTSSLPVTIQLPQITLQSAETTVRVPDRGAVVIGGLKNIRISDQRSEIPILAKIPFLGFFFAKKGKSEELRNLIIIAQATIIDLQEEEERQVGRAVGGE